MWKSKFYGAFVLNHRVVLHAIDATPARWRGDAGSSPLDGTSTATSSPRNDLVKNYRGHPTHWLIPAQVSGPVCGGSRRTSARRVCDTASPGGARRRRPGGAGSRQRREGESTPEAEEITRGSRRAPDAVLSCRARRPVPSRSRCYDKRSTRADFVADHVQVGADALACGIHRETTTNSSSASNAAAAAAS